MTKREGLVQARKAAGYTQESFAEAVRVDRSTVVRWEAGDHEPSPYLWPKIARLLSVSRDELKELLRLPLSVHGGDVVPAVGSGEPSDHVLSSGGLLLPVVIDGHPTFLRLEESALVEGRGHRVSSAQDEGGWGWTPADDILDYAGGLDSTLHAVVELSGGEVRRASEEVKTRFTQTVGSSEQEQGRNKAQHVEPVHSLLRTEPGPSTRPTPHGPAPTESNDQTHGYPSATSPPGAATQALDRDGSAGGFPAVPTEGGTIQRRKTLKLGLALAVAPEVLGRALSDSATEVMEFTQFTGLSAVGRGTLEHLELVVSDLNRAYLKDPPAEQFVVARVYRLRVDELIRGRHTLKELQALYVYAAWLSELLSWLAYDLGNYRTAQAYALDCYTHADQAGHGELCGWAAGSMASIAMLSEHPDSAARAAMQGLVKVSASHPLAVSLRAHAARAYARLGQREPCETLFAEAQQLHERLPARAPCRFTKDTGIIASYAMTAYPASAYLWLRDFDTARTHGEAALAAIESAPPGSREQRQSFAQLILATALVGLGTPDEAVALGSQALTSIRVVTSGVVAYARDLDRALVSRYPRLSCAREFHEQYRQVAQRSATEGKS